MARSQRHKIEEQGYTSRGEIYEQGAINDQILASIGGAIEDARPTLAGISPTTAAVGAVELVLTATGGAFDANTKIIFAGVQLVTTFVSASSITAPMLPATYGEGVHDVQVIKGASLVSTASMVFTITAVVEDPEVEETEIEDDEAKPKRRKKR
jgi:hypothetical protein